MIKLKPIKINKTGCAGNLELEQKEKIKQNKFVKNEIKTNENKTEAKKPFVLKSWKKDEKKNESNSSKSSQQFLPAKRDIIAYENLDSSQKHAIDSLTDEQFGVIVGQAGTGKSTVSDVLIEQLKPLITNKETNKIDLSQIAFVSFTGMAVQSGRSKINEIFQSCCVTIHKLLEFAPAEIDEIDENGDMITKHVFLPQRTASKPIPDLKILIIDEAGTVHVPLWHMLLDALPPDCRIYMLGDMNQLQPVGGHPILGFTMTRWPTFELTKLHRNAGAIAIQADRILKGLKPKWDIESDPEKKVILYEVPTCIKDAKKKLIGIMQHLYKTDRFNEFRDALIVAQNVGDLGKDELNNVLINLFNPIFANGKDAAKRVIIKSGLETKIFSVNDKVMLLKNNNEIGIMNGQIGKIIAIEPNAKYTSTSGTFSHTEMQDFLDNFDEKVNQIAALPNDENENSSDSIYSTAASHIVTVQFDENTKIEFKTSGEVNSLTHAYAITCHKAQGSEFPLVVVFCHSANKRMLCREWLYTAFTRAKERVILVYDNDGLNIALRNQRIRGVGLEQKIKKFVGLMKLKQGEDEKVKLPAPNKITQLNLNLNKENAK